MMSRPRSFVAATLLLSAGLARQPGVGPRPVAAQVPAPSLPDTLTLPAVLERALAVDPSLAAAAAGADAAGHAVEAARADRLPTVATSADLVRFQEPMVVAPLHGLDLTAPPEFDRTLVQGRVGIEWTAWDGGARGARIRRARSGHGAAVAGVEATRQERIADIADAYLAGLTAREVAAARARQLEALQAERDRVGRFLAEGTAARVELLRAEAALSATRADEEGARAARRAAEWRLARALEAPVETIRAAALRDVALAEHGGDPAGGEGAADLSDHPALVAALEQSDAARAAVDAASAGWMPRLQATGALQEYGGASSDFSTEWRTGVRLSWPVFTGGARRAEVDRARAGARRATAEARALERELRTAADRAIASAEEAGARVAALTDAVERFEELVRVEALALAEGVGVQSDYLRAQGGLFDARAGLAAARRDRIRARIALAVASGELDREWMSDHLEDGDPVGSAAPGGEPE